MQSSIHAGPFAQSMSLGFRNDSLKESVLGGCIRVKTHLRGRHEYFNKKQVYCSWPGDPHFVHLIPFCLVSRGHAIVGTSLELGNKVESLSNKGASSKLGSKISPGFLRKKMASLSTTSFSVSRKRSFV